MSAAIMYQLLVMPDGVSRGVVAIHAPTGLAAAAWGDSGVENKARARARLAAVLELAAVPR